VSLGGPVDRHQLVDVPHRHGSEEHGVHEGEDGRVGPDSQRQGEDGDEGEHRAFPEHAGAVADVLPECRHASLLLPRAPRVVRGGSNRWWVAPDAHAEATGSHLEQGVARVRPSGTRGLNLGIVDRPGPHRSLELEQRVELEIEDLQQLAPHRRAGTAPSPGDQL